MEKTWAYRELEIREQIAQRIESELEEMLPPVDDIEYAIFAAVNHAVKIVRGEI